MKASFDGTMAAIMMVVAAAPAMTTVATTNEPAAFQRIDIPVFENGGPARSSRKLGIVKVSVRRAIFGRTPDAGKIYGELWERARKMGADAVIHAKYGAPHTSPISYSQVDAEGIAIRFTDVV